MSTIRLTSDDVLKIIGSGRWYFVMPLFASHLNYYLNHVSKVEEVDQQILKNYRPISLLPITGKNIWKNIIKYVWIFNKN